MDPHFGHCCRAHQSAVHIFDLSHDVYSHVHSPTSQREHERVGVDARPFSSA
jgi:hypothetical protein